MTDKLSLLPKAHATEQIFFGSCFYFSKYISNQEYEVKKKGNKERKKERKEGKKKKLHF